jgi:hypothetical protein
VHIPGGPFTLVLALLIFAIKYVFGVLHALDPAAFAAPRFWLTELAVSGVLTGMFIGRFAGLWRQYRAPHEDLAGQAWVGSSAAQTQHLWCAHIGSVSAALRAGDFNRKPRHDRYRLQRPMVPYTRWVIASLDPTYVDYAVLPIAALSVGSTCSARSTMERRPRSRSSQSLPA